MRLAKMLELTAEDYFSLEFGMLIHIEKALGNATDCPINRNG